MTRVLTQYERARKWIMENPDEAAQILADEAKLSIEVAKKELFERIVLDIDPVPGETQAAVLREIIPIFEAENQLTPGADPVADAGGALRPAVHPRSRGGERGGDAATTGRGGAGPHPPSPLPPTLGRRGARRPHGAPLPLTSGEGAGGGGLQHEARGR